MTMLVAFEKRKRGRNSQIRNACAAPWNKGNYVLIIITARFLMSAAETERSHDTNRLH